MSIERITWKNFTTQDLARLNHRQESGTYGYILIRGQNLYWYIGYIEYENEKDYGHAGVAIELYQYDRVLNEVGDYVDTVNLITSKCNYNAFQLHIQSVLDQRLNVLFSGLKRKKNPKKIMDMKFDQDAEGLNKLCSELVYPQIKEVV